MGSVASRQARILRHRCALLSLDQGSMGVAARMGLETVEVRQ
jgi:hypothetical protein